MKLSILSMLFRRRFDWPANAPLVLLGQGDYRREYSPAHPLTHSPTQA